VAPSLRRPRSGERWLHTLLAACGGFLAATLWFDLMFDVQVLGHAAAPAALPDAALVSIAAYYRRVTTDAHPMQRLIGVVMALTVLGSLWMLRRRPRSTRVWLGVLTSAVPIGLAVVRVFPNAVRLGGGAESLVERSALARAIFVDHVFCLASIAVFTVLQIALAATSDPWLRSELPRTR
jgi:hypothetical protein